MKLVKEHINEKFVEESDPISDMGIGMMNRIKEFIRSSDHSEYYTREPDYLWICARYGKVEFVKYLINNGVDINQEYGLALRMAAIFCKEDNCLKVMKMLIDAGADVHVLGERALEIACKYVGNERGVKLLLDAGAYITDEVMKNAENNKVIYDILINHKNKMNA